VSVTPIALVPREQLDDWLSLADAPVAGGMCGAAGDLLTALRAGGPMFPQNLPKAANLVPAHVEMGLADLLARGFITCDSFAALRQMITPPSRRRHALVPVGRWCCFRTETARISDEALSKAHGRRSVGLTGANEPVIDMVARQLLRRTGVVFRRTLERERIHITWSALRRSYRRLELRGEIRGGRFVSGFSGEQFALPEAVELLRRLRRQGPRHPISVPPTDPLYFEGILTPAESLPNVAIQSVDAHMSTNGLQSGGNKARRQGIVG
jgi:ATP-dependent Lhr-like helicase